MIDWRKPMRQTFEYYVVDPGTWRDAERIYNVKSCNPKRDAKVETLGSASIEIAGTIDECYMRVYLVALQNGVTYRFPLGTFLVQTPSSKFDGKLTTVSLDAYTPLIELKETPPPIGYSLLKGENILDAAYRIVRERARAPVVKGGSDVTLNNDFVSDTDDTWLSFTSDLIANAKFSFDLDELGRILFAPKQDMASLQPVCTFDDGNSSILYPELETERDLYGIPNVVEVVYSDGVFCHYARVVNDDDNSPTSIKNRGREIVYRKTDPELAGNPTEEQVQEYAELLLKELSTLEYTATYTHGYCQNRVGDCVRLNYERAGLIDVKAKVISQSIKCIPGCPVTEKAVYTKKLWG